MIQLLQLEWMKFRKNSVVQMLLWIFLLFFPSLIFIGKEESFTKNNPFLTSDSFFKFPGVWSWLGYDGNWMIFFALGFLVVYMTSIEISYKTMRQNIITGLTRKQYFLSKVLVVLVFTVLATILYAVLGFAIGWVHTPNPTFEFAMDNDWAIGRYFLMCLGYLSFALLIGFAIKNSGLAVLTYLSYGILIEPMIRWLGHTQIWDGNSRNYYPLNAMEDLMPMPLYKAAGYLKNLEQMVLPYSHAAIVSAISIVLFIGLAYYIFVKRDM